MNLTPDYRAINPIPEYQRTSMKPVWFALCFGIGGSIGTILTGSLWGMFCYVPWLYLSARHFRLLRRRVREHKRALDEWEVKMHAYYDNLTAQYRNRHWS